METGLRSSMILITPPSSSEVSQKDYEQALSHFNLFINLKVGDPIVSQEVREVLGCFVGLHIIDLFPPLSDRTEAIINPIIMSSSRRTEWSYHHFFYIPRTNRPDNTNKIMTTLEIEVGELTHRVSVELSLSVYTFPVPEHYKPHEGFLGPDKGTYHSLMRSVWSQCGLRYVKYGLPPGYDPVSKYEERSSRSTSRKSSRSGQWSVSSNDGVESECG